ncbi:MAG TPA: Gldg family protein [Steroidobacteraceae bacterium]|nr:Gldg family protein [Steroidobacteraceae bacterium]
MLRKTLTIAARELRGFFASLAALLFLGVFLAVTLFVFFWIATFFARNIADVRPLFDWMPILLIFLVAALTMRAWAEERRAGTIELLLTSPTGLTEHVLGKFLGIMGLVLIALALTLPLPITVSFMGSLDWGPVVGGYVAAIMLAAAYVAIGLWVSARTDNQVVSLIVTAAIAGAFYLIGSSALTSLVGYDAGEWLRLLGAGSRFASITRGVLDLRDLYYYLSITAVFLALNRLSLEKLRWANNAPLAGHRRWYWVTLLLTANALAANLWLQQIPWARIDLTHDHLYTLSPATKNTLAQLREPLLIRGYFSAETHPLLAPLVPQLHDLLEEYAAAGGGKVHVEFVDPQHHPKLAAAAGNRYGIRPTPFQVSSKYRTSVVNSYFDVLVAYGDQYKVLNFRDLIDVKQRSESNIRVELKNPEYEITSAIRKDLVSYQAGGGLFDTLRRPVTFNGYFSADDALPGALQKARTALRQALEAVQKESAGKFRVTIQDPDGNPALAAQLTHKYGFRPMVVSLLDEKPFWFYMTLGDGRRSEPVPLPAALNEASLKGAIEAAVKRFSPGFLKTVAVLSPNKGQDYAMLRRMLDTSVRWQDTDLKNGRAPSDADMLLVIDPQGLDGTQVFAIDQFLMEGGTVMVASSPQDVAIKRSILGTPTHSGLANWLKTYGLTLSKGLVLDTASGSLPIPEERNLGGIVLNEIRLVKYPYIVDLRGSDLNPHSPITRGLGEIYAPWSGAVNVDAKLNAGRTVTDLLHSSRTSWLADSPTLMPDYDQYPKLGFAGGAKTGPHILAVMLQGRFVSAFKGKPSPLDAAPPPPASAKAPAVPPPPATITNVIDHSPASARLILIASNTMFDDAVGNLISQTLGTRYLKGQQFVQNLVDWSLEDQGLLSIRGRDRFARTLAPMSRTTEEFWEYLNYALALGGLLMIWLISRRRRRRMVAKHLQLLGEG